MRVVVVTPPAPVISLAETKLHLRVDHDDDDSLIAGMLAAATAHIDGPNGWLGRAIGVQTLEVRTDVFRDAMPLPYPPLIDIISVSYLDAFGAAMTVLPAEYEARGSLIGSAFGRRWPSVGVWAEAVRIQYRAGYQALPPPILIAILLMVGDLYRNRTSVTTGNAGATSVPMTTTVSNLLYPFRVWGV